MKKKLVSVFLSAAMTMGILAGCGSSDTTGTNANDKTQSETGDSQSGEVEKIKIYLPTSGKSDDLETVTAAVNDITRQEIGVEVEFHVYEFGQWFQQYSLFLSGTEDVDILANYGAYHHHAYNPCCRQDLQFRFRPFLSGADEQWSYN